MMKISNLKVYGIIYGIENKINNKWYIGQTTKYNGFKGRYSNKGEGIERVYNYHKYNKDKNNKYNGHLLRSIEKYGFDAFEIHEEIDYAFSKDELDIKEKCWILIKDSFKNGYNRCEGGDTQLYSNKYNDEQIKRAKIMLADINNTIEYIEKETSIPIGYLHQIANISTREDIMSELNDIIFKIRKIDYPKKFIEENEELITKLYYDGMSEEDIINSFPKEIINDVIIKKIKKILYILKYRKINQTKICPICNREFVIKNKKHLSRKYCSKKCREISKRNQDCEYRKRKTPNLKTKEEREKIKEKYLEEIEEDVLKLYLIDNIKFTNIWKMYNKNGISPNDIKNILIKNNVYKGKYK